MLERLSFLRATIIIGLISSISACNTVTSWWHPPSQQAPVVQTQVARTAEAYLELATVASPPKQQAYQLSAVRRLIQEQHLTRAGQVLATIDTTGIPEDLTFQKQLLAAKIQLADNKPRSAIALLNNITPRKELSLTTRRELTDTLAIAYEKSGKTTLSIAQRNQLNRMLPNERARLRNQIAIWNSVQHLPPQKVQTLLGQPQPQNIQAWLELSQIVQHSMQQPDQFTNKIADWKARNPNHPANYVLPEQANTAQRPHTPTKIALLLPLHGKYGRQGQAIRNGFMTAYYDTKTQNKQKVTVIDTSKGDIKQHYQTAIQQGADFVIGPLTKTHIQQLTDTTSLTVPTLALNNLNNRALPNLFQFGLNQQDEAIQAANRGILAGYRRAIIIAPASRWGQNIANVFIENWEQQGGTIIDQHAYSHSRDLASDIRNLLEVDKSESRASKLQSILHQKNMRFVPQRRKDVDMVFLVAHPAQARTIQPLMKFYFAGNLPVYATSSIFTGQISPRQDHDLEALQFPEMPFVINAMEPNIQKMHTDAKKSWSKSFNRDPKLYALGIDAYQLTNAIPQLQLFPRASVQGASGTLFLQPNQHIYRKLPWAKMHNGRPVVIE